MFIRIPCKVILQLIYGIGTLTLLGACTNGSTSNNSYATITIPTTTYRDSDSSTKFALYTTAGGGASTLTEIDTGSDYYVIESSYVGSHIVNTGESITLKYDHGQVQRNGYLAYSSVAFLESTGSTIISSNNQVPIVIVADGVISTLPQHNHAILGLRMDNNVSAKLFLPAPYNQMFIFNARGQQLTFGNFSNSMLQNFALSQLPESACTTAIIKSTANVNCWDDMALQVDYLAYKDGTVIESTIDSLFDSGASSSIQLSPLPSWLQVNDQHLVENPVAASLNTSLGIISLPLTMPLKAFENDHNGGIVNVGNNIFNYYQVLFDQTNGIIGLK